MPTKRTRRVTASRADSNREPLHTTAPHGPYETHSAAMKDSADVYLTARLDSRSDTLSRINEGLLLGTLAAAGVSLGAYDRRIVGWLADWEPEVIQVIIGLIERTRAAGSVR
jgi:hypothetical protein